MCDERKTSSSKMDGSRDRPIEVFVQREGGKGFAVASVDPNMRVATLKELALAKLLLHRTLPLDETTLWQDGAASSLDDTCVIRDVIMAGTKLIIHVEAFAGELLRIPVK